MQITKITKLDLEQLKIYTEATENQLLCREDPRKGLFIAESPKVVERALAAGYEPVSMLLEERQLTGEAAGVIQASPDIPIYVGDYETLRNITGYPMTRGILCAMRRRELPDVDKICKGARRIAILERVVNPTNIGAIFRSAAALGMDGILLSPDCCDPLYRRAIRVSMGTVFQIPWTYFSKGDAMQADAERRASQGRRADAERGASQDRRADAEQGTSQGRRADAERGASQSEDFEDVQVAAKEPAQNNPRGLTWPDPGIRYLKEQGFVVTAMALRNDTIGINDPRLKGAPKLAIILGSEGDGLEERTIQACDYTVKIPMYHGVDSLNVAAASAVAFWELGQM